MMKKLLIVDDEPNIVMSLEYAFNKAGFTVFIARDGQEAWDLIQSQEPNMVILDIMMPNMDGYETIEKIKGNKATENIKVVFLSAKSRPQDIEKGMELGAADYFTKPFSVKKVVTKIEALCS
jgi:DNA-binding response OmpR family regulator